MPDVTTRSTSTADGGPAHNPYEWLDADTPCPAWCAFPADEDHDEHEGARRAIPVTGEATAAGCTEDGFVYAKMFGGEDFDWETPAAVVVLMEDDARERRLTPANARLMAAALIATADDLELAAALRGPSGWSATTSPDGSAAVLCNACQVSSAPLPGVLEWSDVYEAHHDHQAGHVPAQRAELSAP